MFQYAKDGIAQQEDTLAGELNQPLARGVPIQQASRLPPQVFDVGLVDTRIALNH